jgi:hypothetical protein
MSKKHELVPFYCRLREETRERLATYAYQHRHSQASVVELALRAYLADKAPLEQRLRELKVPA